MTKYKITLLVEANDSPRKWLPEAIAESLYDENEELLDYEIEEVEE